jgi:hypothetical protein
MVSGCIYWDARLADAGGMGGFIIEEPLGAVNCYRERPEKAR